MNANPAVYTDLQGLTSLRSQAHRDPSKNLREAASQFEAIFIQNMLKSAREAKLATGAMDGPHSDTYKEMYDQQLALTLSKGKGIGIADMLVRQLQGSIPGAGTPPPLHVMRPPSTGYGTSHSSVGQASNTPATTANSAASASSHTANAGTSPHHTPEEFVAAIWPAACKAAGELGVDPKVLVAQAALESGWGRSTPHLSNGQNSHNLFGIKADGRWEGQRAVVSTLEYQDGTFVRRRDPFRAYDSFGDSVSDYAHFLRSNPRYQSALEQANNPDAFLRGLQAAGYATDPTYAHKVASVLHGSTLQQALAKLSGA